MTDSMPSAIAAADAVRRGDVSAVELTEQCLAAIEREQSGAERVRVPRRRRRARSRGGASTRGLPRAKIPGPLAGVPFGVKDLDDCAGMPTTHGSRWYLGLPPVEHDSLHVERLRAAGAIPVGKTAAPEFGTFAYTASPALGVTRNPWNPERTPGRIERRIRGRDRRGHGAVRDLERRRRLDAHAGRLLRSRGPEDLVRTHPRPHRGVTTARPRSPARWPRQWPTARACST